MLAKGIEYGFTHALAVDKVTDIASWQAGISPGWPIYSILWGTDAAVSAFELRTCTPLNLVLCALNMR